jgi:hypothetical protein
MVLIQLGKWEKASKFDVQDIIMCGVNVKNTWDQSIILISLLRFVVYSR